VYADISLTMVVRRQAESRPAFGLGGFGRLPALVGSPANFKTRVRGILRGHPGLEQPADLGMVLFPPPVPFNRDQPGVNEHRTERSVPPGPARPLPPISPPLLDPLQVSAQSRLDRLGRQQGHIEADVFEALPEARARANTLLLPST
jgi:hypothetical protein